MSEIQKSMFEIEKSLPSNLHESNFISELWKKCFPPFPPSHQWNTTHPPWTNANPRIQNHQNGWKIRVLVDGATKCHVGIKDAPLSESLGTSRCIIHCSNLSRKFDAVFYNKNWPNAAYYFPARNNPLPRGNDVCYANYDLKFRLFWIFSSKTYPKMPSLVLANKLE